MILALRLDINWITTDVWTVRERVTYGGFDLLLKFDFVRAAPNAGNPKTCVT